MEAPRIDIVYQAITALYDNPDASEKEKASKWLADVQKSVHSWKIADELLRDKKTVHTYYFGAQTMRAKVQHNLKELNSEMVPMLRDSLIEHLVATTSETSPAILTQLGLALSDLALQMPSWDNCIGDLMHKFSHTQHMHALVELLTVLPQEVDSSCLRLGENRREEIKVKLKQSRPVVFKYLNDNIVNAHGSLMGLKIIKCLTSWIQVRALELSDVPQNAVIGYALQVLREYNGNNTLHETAADCIACLLHFIDYINDNDNEQVEMLLVESIFNLENAYHMAVAQEEEEKTVTYARLFTELAETYVTKIVDHAANGDNHFALKSLELLLICVGHHDYEVAAVTFYVWHSLSEELYNRDQNSLTETFRPFIQRLVTSLARHCQCEPDHTSLPDEDDDFYDFRMKVMDLIKDVVFIVGSSSVFKEMFAALHQDLGWEQTEAALFVMQCVAKNLLPDEYEVVPKVVEAILSMPAGTHNGVRATGVMLLGELSDWVDKNPAALQPAVHTLLSALRGTNADATHAAKALKNICKACRTHMSAHVSGLLELSQNVDSMGLAVTACSDIINGLAATIGRLPPDQMKEAMKQAVNIQLVPLRELIKIEQKDITKGSISDPVRYIDRIAALFRESDSRDALCESEHACLAALSECWPVLATLLDKYSSNSRIVERTCRALRFAIRCLSVHAAPLINPLANKMADVYSTYGHSCILYLMSILVDEMSSVPDAINTLIQLLNALMPQTLTLLMKEGGPVEHPDTVDDLFRLCDRFLQRAPREFLSSACMVPILRCAATCSSVDHRHASSSLMKFLCDLVATAHAEQLQVRELTERLMNDFGEELVYALLEASVLHLHAYMLDEVGEVVHALMRWHPQSVGHWLERSVAKLPQHSPGPSQAQANNFYNTIIRANSCKKVITALVDFSRLYR